MISDYTIPQFCRKHRISRQTYYNLRKRGKGPREMTINSAKRITPEADADWQREREQETA